EVFPDKVKKEKIGPTLNLEKTPDILAELGEKKKEQLLIGFAAETSDTLEKAAEKMRKKKVDLMVANNVSEEGVGFAADENEVWLIWPDGRKKLIPRQSKRKISQEIFSEIEVLLERRKGDT
ncbi:MAG: bifunctional 4'-phosphopantothenoylcysteine decarboxylase/phosphopantothenoylcysteine synthetase, partial [Candidatus Aminicenantes bacterium]|nr:bifunctional 4'-phosphopantothenoylcysteine decarboxylase/phosphopantothenoylcysteine synthetase [Candidatus Aminicenantes bacterium]